MIKIIAVGDSTVHGYSGPPDGASIPTQTWPYRLMVRLGETSPAWGYENIFSWGADGEFPWSIGDGGGPIPPSEPNIIIGTNYTMLNSGVNGEDTDRILHGRYGFPPRWQKDVIDQNPDICIISIGTNDCGMYELPAAESATRVMSMVDDLLSIGSKPIVVKIPSWHPTRLAWVAQYNALLQSGCDARGVVTVDFFAALCNADGSKKTAMILSADDTVHYTRIANQAAADAFDLTEFVAPSAPTHAFDIRLLADPAPTPTHAFDVRLLADDTPVLVRIAQLTGRLYPVIEPSVTQTASTSGTRTTATATGTHQTASIG